MKLVWPKRRASSRDRAAATAGHQHHLDARAQQGLNRPHAEQRDGALTIVQK